MLDTRASTLSMVRGAGTGGASSTLMFTTGTARLMMMVAGTTAADLARDVDTVLILSTGQSTAS